MVRKNMIVKNWTDKNKIKNYKYFLICGRKKDDENPDEEYYFFLTSQDSDWVKDITKASIFNAHQYLENISVIEQDPTIYDIHIKPIQINELLYW